jgi:hypothetical protein
MRSAKPPTNPPTKHRRRRRGAVIIRRLGEPRSPTIMSRVSNGKHLYLCVNSTDAASRRLKDLFAEHVSDLGGLDNISSSEFALCRMASQLRLRLELIEQRWAADGEATDKSLETYQRVSNTLRRHLVTLGLHRRPKDVPSLSQYLRTKTIDAEEIDTEAEP